MKKRAVCLILSMLIIFGAGCDKKTEEPTGGLDTSTTTSTETKEPTTQPQTTQKPTEDTTTSTEESTVTQSTEPVETQGRDPSLPVWFSDDNKKLSYDYEQVIYYMDDLPPNQWQVTIDGVENLYRIHMTDDGLVIEGTGMDGTYLVPGSQKLTAYQLAGANGWAAYVYSDMEILQVDLLTGAVDPLVNPCRVFDVWLCEGGLYYAVEWGGETERLINLYRRAPWGQGDLYPYLTNTFWATTLFTIQHPEHSKSNIYWTQLSPEMLNILKAELANENSPYKAVHQQCWKNADILVDPADKEALKALCLQLQQDTGVPALIKACYDPEKGLRFVEETPIFLEP